MESCGKCCKITANLSVNRFRNLTFHMGLSLVVFCLLYVTPLARAMPMETMLTPKRIALGKTTDFSMDEMSPEYHTRGGYDEYPIMVPKRAALILDRILKEIESAKDGNQLINDWSPISRRGNNKDKLYFRCYFNAVSCYKRK